MVLKHGRPPKRWNSPRWSVHSPSHASSKHFMEVSPNKKTDLWDLPSIKSILKARRVQFAGHCFRAENEIISSFLLWTPNNQTRGRKLSYTDVIARDVGIDRNDLGTVMLDREIWRKHVNSIISTAVEE